jgi:hypothetical protein
MANFLERLIARSQGSSPVVRPQLAPAFGPQLPTLHTEPQFPQEVEAETPPPPRPHSISLLRDQMQRYPETPAPVDQPRELSRRHDPSKSTSPLASPTAPQIDTPAFDTEPQPQAQRLRAVHQEPTQRGPNDVILRHRPGVVSAVQIVSLPPPQSSTPNLRHAQQAHLTVEQPEATPSRHDKSLHQSDSGIILISRHNQREASVANARAIQPFVPSRAQPVPGKTPPEPSVEVTIGRLEVHVHSSDQHREHKSRVVAPTPSLNEFLERRDRRAQP